MFICSNCGKIFTKWQGQCDSCGKWNTIIENPNIVEKGKSNRKKNTSNAKPVKLKDIDNKNTANRKGYLKTGINEFDNTIGGSLVPGQVILLAGSPGVGKSTLALQITQALSNQNVNILYVAGEESPEQIKQRADRLGLNLNNVYFLPESNIRSVENYVSSHRDKIDIVFIDSIQTMYEPSSNSSSGSVSQVSESTNTITNFAKGFGITTFIIGHITKSGDIAGPMILEHMVDTVLFFEGERRFEFRILRVEKNRFGPTDEAGIFRMTQKGLEEVKDTKELLKINKEQSSGSAYSIVLEGSRPVVVEIQALATKTYFTNPRRTTSGFDTNRLYILLAIIDKKLKLKTWEYDVYVNITGGLKVSDPAVDLAVIQAIISSIKDTIIPKDNIYFGEVGLTGEVRKVFLEDKRVKEAKRLGFENLFSSKTIKNIQSLKF